MGKTLDYVQVEETGRLVFRRVYPADVRDFLPKPKSVLKVPLRARTFMTAAAFRIYERAKQQFDEDVKAARAAKQRAAKEREGLRDALTPEVISRLAEVFSQEWHAHDEDALRTRGGDWADRTLEAWDWLLDDFRRWRVEGDSEAIEAHWGKAANRLIEAEGLLVDPEDHDGRGRLLWALNDVAITMNEPAKARTSGNIVPVPPRPTRPTNPRGGARTVSALIDAYRADKWEGWSRSSKAQTAAVFRVLKDTLGERLAASITREDAREVFELVKALPVNLSKQKSLAGLSVPAAVEKAKALGLQTISPRTINQAYMVHMSAIWNFGVKEDWLPKNLFKSLSVSDPVANADKRDAFTVDQLKQLFTHAPWDKPAPHDAAKPGVFWIPLIALFSGVRLGEIAGLRVMDADEMDGVPVLRIRPYEGRTLKNDESRRDLPVPASLVRLGLLAFVEQRKKDAKAEDLLFPDGRATSSRGQFGAKFSERFSRHLRACNITGTKLGMHSFRHGFEDRLKAANVSGTAEALAVSGRVIAGSQSIYGTIGGGFPIANLLAVLEKVTYPGLDLSHLEVGGGDTAEV